MNHIIDIFTEYIEQSIIDSYSVNSNCKNAGILLDRLENHSGYIQWYCINGHNLNLYNKGRKWSITSDTILDTIDTHDKNEIHKSIHNKIQYGLIEIVNKLRDFILTNPTQNQSNISVTLGFREKYSDNDWIINTLTRIMANQNIIRRVKNGRHVYFTNGDTATNNEYIPIPYTNITKKNISQSIGEALIANLALDKGWQFKQQYSFPNCKSKRRLKFDFYFSFNEKDILVEYQGKQHYKFVSKFHKTDDDFKDQVIRDNIKREYCKDNGIELIEIKYDENPIKILTEKFKGLSC